jgi:hypothetical protein
VKADVQGIGILKRAMRVVGRPRLGLSKHTFQVIEIAGNDTKEVLSINKHLIPKHKRAAAKEDRGVGKGRLIVSSRNVRS